MYLFKRLLVLILAVCFQQAHGQLINTIAGISGQNGDDGNGGAADYARIGWPTGLATDSAGNIYISDFWDNTVRIITTDGIINNFVNAADAVGSPVDGTPATAAPLYYPAGVTSDKKGNIYILDDSVTFGPRTTYTVTGAYIRKINAAGIITTVAGSPTYGVSGDGGPATNAGFKYLTGIAADKKGNIYLCGDGRIRKIDTNGIINTIAGADTFAFAGDGGPASAAYLDYPSGIAVDNKGNVYYADATAGRIRRIDTAGIINTIAGTGTYAADTAFVSGAATATNISPTKIAIDDTGNIYIGEGAYAVRVTKIDTSGIIHLFAGTGTNGYTGDGGPATAAEIDFIAGLDIDGQGDAYMASWDYAVVREAYYTNPVSVKKVTRTVSPELQLWPNPCDGSFSVHICASIQTNADVTIHDMLGSTIRQFSCPTNIDQTITLDISPGVYVITALSAEQRISQLITIQ